MNITSPIVDGGTALTLGVATAKPVAAETESMISTVSGIGAPWGGSFGGGGSLFKNMETFPGQVLYTPPKMSAKREGQIARRDSVRAGRHAERTSEHIRGGIDRKTDMVVGATLRVHPQPDWDLLGLNDGEDGWKKKKPFAQACAREFNNWAYDSRLLQDAEGHYNFGGLMWLAFRNIVGPDAECAGIIHYDEARMAAYKARWATYVTILDPDRIQTPADQVGNPNVFEGKKLDKDGRMVGFWVTKDHPSDGITSIEDSKPVYVPRETDWGRAIGFHWFMKTRGGQMRGVTNLTTVMRKTGMLDGFDDAYLGAAVVNQVLSNYIETMASPETVAEQLAPQGGGVSAWDSKLGYYEKAKIRIGGVRIPVMPPGDKVMMTAVNRAIGDPSAFRNGFLREFASALGISFEQLSLNFSDANYSAARAALLEVWRGVLTQRKFFTAHVASLIYAAVIEEAIARGRIEMPEGAPPFQENRAAYTACSWTGPGMGWIDPQKEANAIKTMLEIKLKSRQQAAAEMDGGDYLETFDQIEQERFEAEERGFDLDPLAPGTPDSAAAEEDDDDDEIKPTPKPAPANQE